MPDTNKEAKELILIGDKAYDPENLSPSIYFDYIKDLKQKVDREKYDRIIDNALSMLEKTKITGQTAAAKRIAHQVELCMKEIDAANKGFDIFVNRKDIERYIEKVEGKSIKVIELERYTRNIPDEIVDKVVEAKEIFDKIYIVFTDYTMETTKKVAKERRDKDPIMFGAFVDPDSDDSSIYLEDRFFFIADWVEELCDLTLEQIVRDSNSNIKTYKTKTEFKSDEEIKEFIKGITEPVDKLEPVSIFDKIKKKVTGKSNSDEKAAPKKRRGRPRKKKNDEE